MGQNDQRGKIYMSEKKKGIIKEQNHKLKMFSFLILISLIPLLIAILITSLMSVYMTKNYLEKKCRKYVIYCCIEFGKSLQGK